MGFLDALSSAWEALGGNTPKGRAYAYGLKKTKDVISEEMSDLPTAGETGKAAVLGGLTLLPGAVLDLARAATPYDLDKGFLDEVRFKKGAAHLGDLLGDEGTLTGWTITKTAEGALAAYTGLVEDPIETAIYSAQGDGSDPEAWHKAYELAKQRSLGKTVALTSNEAFHAAGGDSLPDLGVGAAGFLNPVTALLAQASLFKRAGDIDPTADTAWEDFVEQGGFSANLMAGSVDIGAQVVADPLLPVLKGAGALNKARKSKDSFRRSKWDELFGENVDTGKPAVATRNADGELEKALPQREFKPGRLDQWKNADEIYVGLRLDKLHYAGHTVAKMLDETRNFDPVTRLNARRAIVGVLHGDKKALDDLNNLAPEFGFKFARMLRGRGTGSVDAAVADADNVAEIAAGRATTRLHDPDVVADTEVGLKTSDGYNWMLGSLREDTLRATAKGNRAVARTRRQGLGRDGTLHTGIDVVDSSAARIFTDGPFSGGALIMRGGIKTIGWASGLTPAAKALAKGSDALRDKRVYGQVNLEDPQLVVAVVRHMMRVSGVDQAQASEHVSRVIGAQSPAKRGEAVDAAQELALRTLAKRYGVNEQTAIEVARSGMRYTQGMVDAADAQTFGAMRSSVDPDRFVGEVYLPDGEGNMVLIGSKEQPVLNTQTRNSAAIMDLERAKTWLRRDHFTRALGHHATKITPEGKWANPLRERFESMVRGGQAIKVANSEMVQGLAVASEGANSMWKSSVLLTRAGSYALRNASEEILRTVALSMASSTAMRAAEQAKFYTKGGKLKGAPPELTKELSRRRAEYDDWFGLEAHEGIRGLLREFEDAGRVTDKDYLRLKSITEAMDEAKQGIDGLQKVVDNWRPETGFKDVTLKDGTVVSVPRAFDDAEGEAFWDLIRSGDAGFDSAMAQYSMKLHGLMADDSLHYSVRELDPSNLRRRGLDPARNGYLARRNTKAYVRAHLDEWEHILNLQIRQDAVGQMGLKLRAQGKSRDEIAEEFKQFFNSPASKQYRRENPVRSRTETWADDAADLIDQYVPSQELAQRLVDGRVAADDLDGMFSIAERPDVHRATGSMVFGTSGQLYEAVTGSMFRAIDRMTLQRMTRSPVFSIYFDEAIERRASAYIGKVRAENGPDATISLDEINMLASEARKEASHRLKQTFYDATVRSSAAHQLRFMYPFFAAHQDSMRFWGKAIADDPSALRKLQIGFQAPANMGLVVDENNQPKDPGQAVNPLTDKIVAQLPPWMGGGVEMNVSSAMLMLQSGAILNPGAGPAVAVPVNVLQLHLASSDEDWERATKFFQPWGAPKGDLSDSLLPTPIKRLQEARDAMNKSGTYVHLYQSRLADAYVDYLNEHDGVPPSPTDPEWARIQKDVAGQVKAGAMLRVFASVVSPLQPRPVSKHEAFRQEFKRLQDYSRQNNLGPEWALDKFLDDYGPEYLALTVSPSENRSHLPPTQQMWASLKAHKNLRSRVPVELWPLIVGNEANGDGESPGFSINAYRAMQKLAVTEDGQTLITDRSAADYFSEIQRVEAWNIYNKRLKELQADAIDRGYDLPEDDPEFVLSKRALKAEVGAQYPVWLEDMVPQNPQAFEEGLFRAASVIAEDRKLLRDTARTDIKWLAAYVDARRQVMAVLQQRADAGVDGGANINSAANKPLKAIFSRYVASLLESNIEFDDYARYSLVERDPFYDETMVSGAA